MSGRVLGYCTVLLALLAFSAVSPAMAGMISINYSENSGNQGFAGNQSIGPLNSNSSNWNNTNGQPNLVTGTLSNLVDNNGANTGASMTWNCSNVWYNNDGLNDDQHKMAVGYLDDWGDGVQITVNNVPYSAYEVYLLFGSDWLPTYDSRDFKVNGSWALGGANPAATIPAYGGYDAAGGAWIRADDTTRGNYLLTQATGSTLTIEGIGGGTAGSRRGSLTAIVINEVPEPATWSLIGTGLLAAVLIVRRRRA